MIAPAEQEQLMQPNSDNNGCVFIGCVMMILCPLLIVSIIICVPLIHFIFRWWLG